MKRTTVLLYGVTNYLLGAGGLVYLIAFIFNLFAPVTVDSGEAGNPYIAAAIDIGLIALFGVQHSIMARPRFKQWIMKYIPHAAERSTFMLATAIVVLTIVLLWEPIPGVIWKIDDAAYYNTVLAVGLSGWALVFYSTFLINHFDLFGLRQVWLYFTGKPYTPLPFKLNALYKLIRHPIMTGIFIGSWFTPVMTVGHLVLSIGLSAYILIGVYYEERDLVRNFGDRYIQYMKSTAKFIPGFGRHSGDTAISNQA